jgi:hypothetical protein
MYKQGTLRAGVVLGAALVLFGLRAHAARAAEPDDNAEAIRQVSIMAKVLETRLKEELPGELVEGSIFQPGGVRGFRVPGVGVIFQANVDFAVAERKPARKPSEDAPDPDDLWDRIERGRTGDRRASGSPWTPRPRATGHYPFTGAEVFYGARAVSRGEPIAFDRRKAEALERVVLEVLAKYGERMSAIAADDRIVVLVGGAGSNGGQRLIISTSKPSAGPAMSSQDSERLLAQLREEIGEMEEDLGQAKEDRLSAEELLALTNRFKEKIEEQRRQIESRSSRGQPEMDLLTTLVEDYRTLDGHPGGMPPTSWSLTVRKIDLKGDPAEVRKQAEIQAY